MCQKYLFAFLLPLMAACSKTTDFSASGTQPEEGPVVNSMNIPIDRTHTWSMTAQRTLTVESLPTDFMVNTLMILDANPFTDNSATILAKTEDMKSTISYEAPAVATKLYAACTDGVKMRVRAFNVSEGKVNFAKDLLKMASAKAPAHRAPANLSFQPTLNATLFADKGWADEFAMLEAGDVTVDFTNFSEYTKTFSFFLPEQQRNNRKLASYDEILSCYSAIVADDEGEVMIIPVHKESVASQCIGYYYFLPGQEHNIKTVRKYVFPAFSSINDNIDVCSQTALRLVYYDEEGNASYQFPKGTSIGFFLHVDQTTYNTKLRNEIGRGTHMDWYVDGKDNVDLSEKMKEWELHNKNNSEDGWQEISHVVMFERNGEAFVGMEDWIQDFDYNDIIFMIRGAIEPLPSSNEAVPNHSHIYTYAFEDTDNGDYDLNDVVLQVKRIWGSNIQEVKLVAVGAWDRLKVCYRNENGEEINLFKGREVHELLGVGQQEFVNTQTLNIPMDKLPTDKITFDYKKFLYTKADFYIKNETTGAEIHIPTAVGKIGSNPYGVCIPYAWAWPLERTSVKDAYSLFKGFAENQQVNTDWYTQPVEGKVFLFE